jgi:hypothetical protein
MFTKTNALEVAVLILGVAAVAAVLSCSNVSTTAADTGKTYGRADPSIWGTVYTTQHVPVEDAYVKWNCLSCSEFLDSDYSDSMGYYEVTFDDHDGCNLMGEARKAGVGSDSVEIKIYDESEGAEVDFTLMP